MTDTRNSDLTYAAGDVIGFLAPFPTADPGNMNELTSPWLCLGWLDTSGTTFKLAEAMKALNAAGTLDPIRTIVTAAPKTFDVLRYLVENAGRLVSHDELLTALWRDVHVQPEVLKSYILAIRNALGDKSASPRFIETQRGRGYPPVSSGRAQPPNLFPVQ